MYFYYYFSNNFVMSMLWVEFFCLFSLGDSTMTFWQIRVACRNRV